MKDISTRFLSLIAELIDFKEVKDLKDFASAIGVNRSSITEINKGRTNVSLNLVQKTVQKFPFVNVDWLITGEGEKYKTTGTENATFLESVKAGDIKGDNPTVQKTPPLPKIPANIKPIVQSLKDHINQIDLGKCEQIPIMDITAAAGAGAYNSDYVLETDIIQLPAHMVKRGLHHCIKIKGQSMYPTFQDGSYIVIRLLNKAEWTRIKDREIYVIVTREGETFVKRVKNRLKQGGYITCISDNPDKVQYPSFDIEIEDINTFWAFEWYLSSKTPDVYGGIYNEIRELREEMDEVKDFIRRLKN